MDQSLDFKVLFYMLRKKFVWIVIAAFLGMLAAFFISEYFMTDTYVSTSQVYISNTQEMEYTDRVNSGDLSASKSMATTYCIILQSRRATDLLKAKLAQDEFFVNTPEALQQYLVTVSVWSNTEVLTISVKAYDPNIAALVCNTMIDVSEELISEIFESGRANSLGDASLNLIPASPNTRINMLIGAIAGIAIAAVLIVLSYLIDNRVKDASDFVRKVGIPVLGEVPSMHTNESGTEGYAYYGNH